MPIAPIPSASALEHATSKPPPSKPAGAYRPPGARGLAAPSIFKREDEGGVPHRSNGISTPPRGYNRSPGPGGHANGNGDQNGKGGRNGRRAHVPGAPMSSSGDSGEKKGKQKKKKKEVKELEIGDAKPVPPSEVLVNGSSSTQPSAPEDGAVPLTPATEGGSLDPIAKKIRNLNKKVQQQHGIRVCAKADLAVVTDQGNRGA